MITIPEVSAMLKKESPSRERSRKPEAPFCWQSKNARKRIRDHMNADSKAPAVLSLYDALTEIASNEGKESFKAGQPFIGTFAGMSGKNVARLEHILEECGVVIIDRQKKRGHHTYTLISAFQFGQSVLSGKASSSDNLSVQFGQSRIRKCPPVEEQKEEPKEKREEVLSLEVAIARYVDDPRFAHLDVKGSLTKRFKQGRIMIPSAIEGWLTREDKARIQPRPQKSAAGKEESQEQPISEAEQAALYAEFERMKAQALQGKNGAEAAAPIQDQDEEELLRILDAQAQQLKTRK
jgi:hypothetical protein